MLMSVTSWGINFFSSLFYIMHCFCVSSHLFNRKLRKFNMSNFYKLVILGIHSQGQPLGGASGALVPGADFEGAPKRQSPTGHTLIHSSLAWWFPHLQKKRVAKEFLKFGCIGFSLFWCVLAFTYVYSCYALCLLLQILFVAALDIKTRDVPTVSPINSLLSQYCKASHFFLQIFMYWERGACQLFALPRLSHGQRPALSIVPHCVQIHWCLWEVMHRYRCDITNNVIFSKIL
jgi:hypothetical protein